MIDDDERDDMRREAIEDHRARRRATRCQCGPELPGRCPGPSNCPYSGFAEPSEDDDEIE